MKGQRIVVLALLVAGAAALGVLQRRQVNVEITPRPLLYLVADTQREIERIPLRLTRISDQEENQIGDELVRAWGLRPRHRDDAQRIAEWVHQVGARLVRDGGIQRPAIRYRFLYEHDAREVNAFALPGGTIFIGRGLLELMESEDELAAVLAHEIAHVDRRHCAERLQYEVKARKLGLGGLYAMGRLGVQLFRAGYSKVHEEEADLDGLRIMVKAGYDPAAAVDMHRKVEVLMGQSARPSISPIEEVARIPGAALQEYFRSHPSGPERIAGLEREIKLRKYVTGRPRKPIAVRAIFLVERAGKLRDRGLYDRALQLYAEALKSDGKYLPALYGRATTLDRTGDTAAAHQAAIELIQHYPGDDMGWRLVARTLPGTPAKRAAGLRELLAAHPPEAGSAAARITSVDLAGFEYLAGDAGALARYQQIVTAAPNAETEENLRRRMAWTLYLHGRYAEAERELLAGWQRYPRLPVTRLFLGWVLTEMGRQGDALAMLEESKQSGVEGIDLALEALIVWRTGERDRAQEVFRRAVQMDPVWMGEKWVHNHYAPAAAAVFRELQSAETARRRQEELRRGRKSAPAPR